MSIQPGKQSCHQGQAKNYIPKAHAGAAIRLRHEETFLQLNDFYIQEYGLPSNFLKNHSHAYFLSWF